jgi:hypothetical protein
MNRWHTTTGHGLLDMYRCETGPLDSDEGRRLKISGDCRFRDSAFNHSSDIRKGAPGKYRGTSLSTTIPGTSRLFRGVALLREPCPPSQASFYSGSSLINRFSVLPPPS